MEKWTVSSLETFGRTRLSSSFFMREMLHSEIAEANCMLNVPSDVELAVEAGSRLCERVLEPIQACWGRIVIRSAFRSEEVNDWGNRNRANCSSNEKNYAAHIWDRRDSDGFMGATACIVIPSYLDYFEKTGDWTSLAWWIHHHVPQYSELKFFKHQCAFNVRWHEDETRPKNIRTFIADPMSGNKKPILKSGVVQPPYNTLKEEERYSRCKELMAQS